MSDPVQRYFDAILKAKELKAEALQYLLDRKKAIESELKEIDGQIAAMTGEQKPNAERVKGPKYTGKQVSFKLLSEMLRGRPDRTLNLRKEGYDTKWMKKLVEENPGKLELGGAGPWPTVMLVGY